MKFLPLLLCLAGCTGPEIENFGIVDSNLEPWPVLSVQRGTLGWVQKQCKTGMLPYRKYHSLAYAACSVPVDKRDFSKGIRVYWTWDCAFSRDHELQAAAEGKHKHTVELEALLVQGRSMCNFRSKSNE